MADLEPSEHFQISKWNAYDVSGFRLPRKSMAAKWRRRKLLLTLSLGFSVEAAAIWLGILFHPVPTLSVLPIFILGIPAIFAYDFAKRRFLRQWVGEDRPSEPIVGVRFVVDGFEYGQDIGFISFERDWIYFAGEQTTFSLGPSDFEYEYVKPRVLKLGKILVRLHRTTRWVEIHFDGVSLSNATLHRNFLQWRRSARQNQGICVLPPLEFSNWKDFDRWQELGTSAAIGSMTLAAMLGISNFLLGSMFPLVPHTLLFGVLLVSAAATVGAHRVFVGRRRAKAFRHLARVRESLAPDVRPLRKTKARPSQHFWFEL